MIGKYQM